MTLKKKSIKSSDSERTVQALLVTGGTGFLGPEVLKRLGTFYKKIFLLVRPQSLEKVKIVFEGFDKSRLHVVIGDLRNQNIIESESDLALIRSEVTSVLHMGAIYDFTVAPSENYLSNVVGTQNLLHFCRNLVNLKRFYLTSTLAIAGDYSGILYESMFNVGQTFSDSYAETKFRVEGLIGSWNTDVKRVILRLGVIVGDSQKGRTHKIDGPYYLLRSLRKHRAIWKTLSIAGVTPFPYSPHSILYLVPVDAVADGIVKIIENPHDFEEKWRTYHLTGPGVSLKDFFHRSFSELGYVTKLRSVPQWVVPKSLYPTLGIPAALQQYMYSSCVYVNQILSRDYPAIRMPHFESYANEFFEFVKSDDFKKLKVSA